MAGTLTTVSFVPQVVKIWKSKHAGDVSGMMFAIFSGGVVLWLSYGIMLRAWPIIVANAITLVLSVSVLVLKWKWRSRPSQDPL